VKAIEKKMRELRPVASIACLVAAAFHPAKPKVDHQSKDNGDVTNDVIRQPWNVLSDQRE
jgi:hypothetical protein